MSIPKLCVAKNGAIYRLTPQPVNEKNKATGEIIMLGVAGTRSPLPLILLYIHSPNLKCYFDMVMFVHEDQICANIFNADHTAP